MYQPQTSSNISVTSYNPYSTTHYPNQYNAVPASSTAASLPLIPHTTQPRSSPAPELPPSPLDLSSVTEAVASHTMRRLIASELREIGFDSAEAVAVERLELEVAAFIEQLFGRAHEFANLANRAGAIASDLMLACKEFNLPPKALRTVKARANKNRIVGVPVLVTPPSRSPSPVLLPSDDEDSPLVVPPTLRGLPSYFPDLPPKHTYLRTPASPPKKAALPSLEKKLKTASLVQESLKNLMLATEDSTGQEDGELLGHIVNWEMGVYPRKRWKIGL